MCRRISTWTFIAWAPLRFASTGWTDIPAPPVNQDIGMPDVAIGDLTEADCRVCHDAGVADRHHLLYGQPIPPGTVVPNPDTDGDGTPDTVYACLSCHNGHFAVVRDCISCHGPDSLHNIQADSPASGNIGTIVIGGEDAGYGHVGRDAGPGDSDCWGCHGFSADTLAPLFGPLTPTIYDSHPAVVKAGTDTLVMLSGTAFSNTVGETRYESKAVLTAADGSSVTLPRSAIEAGLLTVVISGNTAPGNYSLQAVKTDDAGDPVVSNPTVLSVVPTVIISDVSVDGVVTIEGQGFSGYAEDSGTSVTGTITTVKDGKQMATTVEATIVFWSDTNITADFGASPQEVTVNSVFGSETFEIGGTSDEGK